MKVLILTEKPFAADALAQMQQVLTEAGVEVCLLEKYTDKTQVLEAVADVDGLIVRSDIVDKAVFDAAPNLKIVVRAGAGYDNIDLQAATAAGAVAMNTPGQNANAVAELVFAMMLFMARTRFQASTGSELKGKKLGLHAYGNVGRNVARIAKGFGMEVYAYDPFLSAEKIEAEGVHATKSVEELYETCQYVSLHIPYTAETAGSINMNLLSRMPKKATLINTARKEVVNEPDLLQILADREDFRYIADVKPAAAEEFESRFGTRVLFTPKKSGAQTAEANTNAGVAAAKQSVDFLLHGIDRFRVN